MKKNKDVNELNKVKEAFELLEKMKDLLRFNYDYHKHLIALSTGSILIIITILEGIFKMPKAIMAVLSSIVCFVLSIIFSIKVMSMMVSITASLVGMHSSYLKGNLEEIQTFVNSGTSTSKRGEIVDKLSSVFFFLGIATLVTFAFINFL